MADPQLDDFIELVRRVRHDANNPLTALLGHVRLLLDDPAIPAGDARESLEVVDRELHRLAGILRQLDAVRP
jgi:signal transduction histidine kinase